MCFFWHIGDILKDKHDIKCYDQDFDFTLVKILWLFQRKSTEKKFSKSTEKSFQNPQNLFLKIQKNLLKIPRYTIARSGNGVLSRAKVRSVQLTLVYNHSIILIWFRKINWKCQTYTIAPSWLWSAMSSPQSHSSLANLYLSLVTKPSKTGGKNSQILLNFTNFNSKPLQSLHSFSSLKKFPTGSTKRWSRFSGWWLSTASRIPWSTLVTVFPRKWAQAYLRDIWELLTNMIHIFRDPYLTIWRRLQYLACHRIP